MRFPVQSAASRRDVLIGAAWLLVPVVGWLMNMGHRIRITHRMLHAEEPWPAWERPGELLRHGLVTFAGMVLYHAPAAGMGMVAIVADAPVLQVFAVVLWLLGTAIVPGYMTAYSYSYDPRDVFIPMRAIRRTLTAGREYWHAWLIVLVTLPLSFVGLLGFGLGFFITSVWFWQTAAFSFATVMARRDGLLQADAVMPGVATA